jgi:hyaluronan synthase
VNLLVPGALQVLWPAMCIYGLASGWLAEHLLQDMQLYFGLWVVVGLLYNLYVRWHNPEQKVNPLIIGALGMWFIADSFLITLVALCTFDVGEWGTRGTSTKKV